MFKSITPDGGVNLVYEIRGDGPAILCIQGVGVIGRGWTPQLERLSSAFRVITFDHRGLGASVPCQRPITIEAMAADALAIVDAEGIGRFHVMGHSMGGLVAQQVALTAPTRVQSLSLLCTFARGRDATALSLRMLLLSLRSRLGTRPMRRAGMLRIIMPDHYLRRVDRLAVARELGILFGRDLADQPSIVWAQLRAMRHYDATPRLDELSSIPTLVVSGSHDPIAPPRFGRQLAARIRTAVYVEFAEAGHALPIQCADRLHTVLLPHLHRAHAAARIPTF